MRLCLLYDFQDGPWGGVNSFFRNFARCSSESTEVELTDNPGKADLILSPGHYYAPGRMIDRRSLRSARHGLSIHNPLGPWIPWMGSKKLVFRIDGLRQIYAGVSSKADEVLIDNLDLAHSVVFQSSFSKQCFDNLGISYPRNSRIIHNGADENLFYPSNNTPDFSKDLVLISNSWSTNLKKGFEMISLFSEITGVSVLHIGRWPVEIDRKCVKLLGTMKEKEIARTLREGHFFLFPSKFEACPNTVVEALATGLPILYHQSGGTPELCQDGYFGMGLPARTTNIEKLESFLSEAIERYHDMRSSIIAELSLFSFQACFNQYVQNFLEIIC